MDLLVSFLVQVSLYGLVRALGVVLPHSCFFLYRCRSCFCMNDRCARQPSIFASEEMRQTVMQEASCELILNFTHTAHTTLLLTPFCTFPHISISWRGVLQRCFWLMFDNCKIAQGHSVALVEDSVGVDRRGIVEETESVH